MNGTVETLIQEGEKRGEEMGRKKGEDRAWALIRCLMQDERSGLILRVTEDSLLREKLYRQYRV